MKRTGVGLMALAALLMSIGGCGGSGGGDVADQPKMSPEEVQKEIQKLSPPAIKGKSKSK